MHCTTIENIHVKDGLMDQQDVKSRQKEADSLRTVAFFGVALSTIATLVCVISVPMI